MITCAIWHTPPTVDSSRPATADLTALESQNPRLQLSLRISLRMSRGCGFQSLRILLPCSRAQACASANIDASACRARLSDALARCRSSALLCKSFALIPRSLISLTRASRARFSAATARSSAASAARLNFAAERVAFFTADFKRRTMH